MRKIFFSVFVLVFIFLFFVLTDIFLIPTIFTRVYPRPQKGVGLLLINPFFTKSDIDKISKKMGVINDSKKKLEMEFTDRIEIGYFQMGESGIEYKCQKTNNANKVLVAVNWDRFDGDTQLLAKRIYWSLLFCSVSGDTIKDKAGIRNYLSELVFSKRTLNPALLL